MALMAMTRISIACVRPGGEKWQPVPCTFWSEITGYSIYSSGAPAMRAVSSNESKEKKSVVAKMVVGGAEAATWKAQAPMVETSGVGAGSAMGSSHQVFSISLISQSAQTERVSAPMARPSREFASAGRMLK